MGKIFDQTITELKHLPLMLGKLIGGLTAVIGFTAAVITTRTPAWAPRDILPYLLMGCLGGVIFILSARSLKRRLSSHAVKEAPPHRQAPHERAVLGAAPAVCGDFPGMHLFPDQMKPAPEPGWEGFQ